MCYHVSIPTKERLKKDYPKHNLDVADYSAAYHTSGFAHPQLPVLLNTEAHKIQPVSWGFIPFWAKPEEAAMLMNKTLNARAETIFTTPMFRAAAPGYRCLIFVDGFFEWKHERKAGKIEKIPHYIQLPDHKTFTLGGLWSYWTGKKTGERITTCNVITTPANKLMTSIHNSKKRMPLILQEEQWGLWLDENVGPAEVTRIMQPYPEDLLEAHEVSRLISTKGAATNVAAVQEAV